MRDYHVAAPSPQLGVAPAAIDVLLDSGVDKQKQGHLHQKEQQNLTVTPGMAQDQFDLIWHMGWVHSFCLRRPSPQHCRNPWEIQRMQSPELQLPC
mmetsp:Transcript_60141/g.119319  ORF Transcript_60141/g.119319 Transcript_60141/m.119319 type:complete len:96 (+) Transcript_60141:1009-1296(+)